VYVKTNKYFCFSFYYEATALLAVQCYKVSPWPMATAMFALRPRPEACPNCAYFAGTDQ